MTRDILEQPECWQREQSSCKLGPWEWGLVLCQEQSLFPYLHRGTGRRKLWLCAAKSDTQERLILERWQLSEKKDVAQSEDSSWNKRIQSQFGISSEVSSAQKCVSPLGLPEKEGRIYCVAYVKDLKTGGKKNLTMFKFNLPSKDPQGDEWL